MLSPSTARFLIVLFVALGSLTYGYSASIIATTLGQPSFIKYFNLDTRSDADGLIGAVNGLFQTGGLFGTLSCIHTADVFGRRKALFISALVTLVGGALQAGSVNIGMFIAFRFVTGVGIGALVTLVPLYQSEIVPPKIRGLLVGVHGVLICVGYTSSSWVGLGFYFVNANGAQWRIPLAIQCLPPLGLCLGIMFMPETPRWLLTKDRAEDAYKSFTQTRAESSEDHEAMQSEFTLLYEHIQEEKKHYVHFIDLFKRPALRKRVIVGFLTMFGAQATATLVINNYGPSLYKALGYGTVQQLLLQGGWISICPFGNALNAVIVDKVGRVNLLMFGFAGSVSALIGECITVDIFVRTGNKSAASAAVFFLFWHIICFSSSVDATSYIYASEIFPTPVRAKGLAASISGLFIATIIFLQLAPTAFAAIGWRYYIVFIAITSAIVVVMFFYFPETKGRSLEEMGELFGDAEIDYIGDHDEKNRLSVSHEEVVAPEAVAPK